METPLGLDEVQAQLATLFTQTGFRWIEVSTPRVERFVVIRRGMVLWARPLGYAALLLALVALAIVGIWGWQSGDWQPVPGESRAIAQGTPYVVRLDAFDLQFDDAEQLQNYSSQITWLEGETEVQQDAVDVDRASTHRGATVRQVGFVPVVRLRGWDREGRLLTLDTPEDALSLMGEVEIRFASPEARPLVFVPGHDVFLALTFEPVCAQGKPALYVEPVQAESSEPEERRVLYDSGSIMVDSLRFEVELFYAPVLRADFRPGMSLVVGSLVLFMISLIALWLAPPWLAWISAGPGEEENTRLRIQVLPGAGSDRQLRDLTHRLEEVLVSDD